MTEEANRAEASLEHRDKCQEKIDILLEQRTDLSTAIDDLLTDIENGHKFMKVYKQKMYNDDELNPILYQNKSNMATSFLHQNLFFQDHLSFYRNLICFL
jgi:hypothetical protein